MSGTTQSVKRQWGISSPLNAIRAFYTSINNIITDLETLRAVSAESNILIEELHDDHATFRTVVAELVTDHATFKAWGDRLKTRCVTPPTFVIDSNFDIKNSVAFEIEVAGILKTVAANVNFDTGTATVIATDAFWAIAILSIDVDGTTAGVDWGAEASTEAAAKTNAASVTAAKAVVVGYAAVRAKASEDFVAGTDALNGGSGGQVAQTTTYYNDQYLGDAVKSPPATLSNAGPATLGASKPSSSTVNAAGDMVAPAISTIEQGD